MTALATIQNQDVAQFAAPVVDYQTRAVQRLAEWAQAADTAYTVAARLVETSFCPQQFKGKPYEATAAILAGSEVGLSPMAALRSFDIIQGTAAARAITLRAIVQSYGHEIELVESTATRCRMRGKRRGSQTWQPVTWTIERAQAMGLTGKDNWKKQPGAMLVARATSEIARLIASDAILGSGSSAEEIYDGARPDGDPSGPDEFEATAADEPKAKTRTLSRSRAKAAPATTAENEIPAEVLSTAEQREQIRVMFDAEGVSAADRPGRIEQAIGRPVKRMHEMTSGEADRLIAALSEPVQDALPVEDPPTELDPTVEDPWAKGGEVR